MKKISRREMMREHEYKEQIDSKRQSKHVFR